MDFCLTLYFWGPQEADLVHPDVTLLSVLCDKLSIWFVIERLRVEG